MLEVKRPALTAEFVRSILDYDQNTGIFHWKHRPDYPRKWNSRYAGTIAGYPRFGYIVIMIAKSNYTAHVLAWLYMTGEWAPGQIDHRHGVRADNRFSELRKAAFSDNGCNKRMQSNNKTGVVGVWFNTQAGKYDAQISKNGRRVWRQRFNTVAEAAEARRKALQDVHGEFAVSDPERPRYRHTRDQVT